MTPSLYDKDQSAWDAIAVYRPNVAAVARQFSTESSMEDALGFGDSVITKWVKKRGGVSLEAERRAITWLAKQRAATPAPPPAVAPSGTLLLVSCPDAARVTRVLQLLGCEVIEAV